MQLINPSTLNTTLMPHSIIHGDAYLAYFNKIWGIPWVLVVSVLDYEEILSNTIVVSWLRIILSCSSLKYHPPLRPTAWLTRLVEYAMESRVAL